MIYKTTLVSLLSSLAKPEVDSLGEAIRERVSKVLEYYPLLTINNVDEFYRAYFLGLVETSINLNNTGYMDSAIAAENLLVSYATEDDEVIDNILVGFDNETPADHPVIAYELAEGICEDIVTCGKVWSMWNTLAERMVYGNTSPGLRVSSANFDNTDTVLTAETLRPELSF